MNRWDESRALLQKPTIRAVASCIGLLVGTGMLLLVVSLFAAHDGNYDTILVLKSSNVVDTHLTTMCSNSNLECTVHTVENTDKAIDIVGQAYADGIRVCVTDLNLHGSEEFEQFMELHPEFHVLSTAPSTPSTVQAENNRRLLASDSSALVNYHNIVAHDGVLCESLALQGLMYHHRHNTVHGVQHVWIVTDGHGSNATMHVLATCVKDRIEELQATMQHHVGESTLHASRLEVSVHLAEDIDLQNAQHTVVYWFSLQHQKFCNQITQLPPSATAISADFARDCTLNIQFVSLLSDVHVYMYELQSIGYTIQNHIEANASRHVSHATAGIVQAVDVARTLVQGEHKVKESFKSRPHWAVDVTEEGQIVCRRCGVEFYRLVPTPPRHIVPLEVQDDAKYPVFLEPLLANTAMQHITLGVANVSSVHSQDDFLPRGSTDIFG